MHDSAIIPSEQSGFQPKVRLATRVLALTEAHRASIFSNRFILTFYLDFKSAFDRISHVALLVKLHRQDMPYPLLQFFFSWLKNRTAQISFGSKLAPKFDLEWRLPQGFSLSHLIFISFLFLILFQFLTHMKLVFITPFREALIWLEQQGQK